MKTQIALLKAVNMVGKHKMPMKGLVVVGITPINYRLAES